MKIKGYFDTKTNAGFFVIPRHTFSGNILNKKDNNSTPPKIVQSN